MNVAPDLLTQITDPVQLVSLLGAVMQLAAYALMQLGRLPSQSYPYQLANVIGSFMMTVVATLNHEYGFILMEAIWFLTSAYGLVKLLRSQPKATPAA
ncbi:MAG: hypothetical protein FJ077_02220 [Cyanobacteria bacterium K_DeepCast_35m_m2_023]|nr:hypothetical protein [Cyanobacteria bacterium K_DeepCast_35m_m2_023]